MMIAKLSILFLAVIGLGFAADHSYVTSVDCNAVRISVKLNTSSVLFTRTNGIFVVYSESSDCHAPLAQFGFDQKDSFTLFLANCNVTYNAMYGANGKVEGYNTYQRFRAQANFSRNANYTFDIACYAGAHGHAQSQTNGTSVGGGWNSNNHPNHQNIDADKHVFINLTDGYGNWLNPKNSTVYVGMDLTATVSLSEYDDVYGGMLPTDCYFTNHDETAMLPFISDSCPDLELVNAFSQIKAITRETVRHYTVNFKAFLFNNPNYGLLRVKCDVLLCLQSQLCDDPCWQVPSKAFTKRTDRPEASQLGDGKMANVVNSKNLLNLSIRPPKSM